MQVEETGGSWMSSMDIIDLVLERMNDATIVCKSAKICRSFRRAAGSDAIWERLVRRRWTCKLKGSTSGEGHWKNLYQQWSISRRQPSCSFSGELFPAFATSHASRAQRFERFHTRRFDKREETGIRLWVTCVNSQDCSCVSGADPSSTPTLTLNVVVQNFSTTPVSVNPVDATLILRTGLNAVPAWDYRGDFETCGGLGSGPEACPPPRVLAVWDGEEISEDTTEGQQESNNSMSDSPVGRRGSIRVRGSEMVGGKVAFLNQWDYAVLGEIKFQLPQGVQFEPDALEMCKQLKIPVKRHGAGYDQEEGEFAGAVVATAEFDENKIWRHYSELPGRFFVFSRKPLGQDAL